MAEELLIPQLSDSTERRTAAYLAAGARASQVQRSEGRVTQHIANPAEIPAGISISSCHVFARNT